MSSIAQARSEINNEFNIVNRRLEDIINWSVLAFSSSNQQESQQQDPRREILKISKEYLDTALPPVLEALSNVTHKVSTVLSEQVTLLNQVTAKVEHISMENALFKAEYQREASQDMMKLRTSVSKRKQMKVQLPPEITSNDQQSIIHEKLKTIDYTDFGYASTLDDIGVVITQQMEMEASLAEATKNFERPKSLSALSEPAIKNIRLSI